MQYKTKLTCRLSVFTSSLDVSEIESIFRMKAVRSKSKGQFRSGKSGPTHDRSSAQFVTMKSGVHDPVEVLRRSLDLIRRANGTDDGLEDAEVWINLGLEDGDFVQVVLPAVLIAELSELNVGVAIENRVS